MTPSLDRKIPKPFWLDELPVQERLIWLGPATTRTRLPGAAGAVVGGVAPVMVVLEMFDGAESPAVTEAAT